MTPTEIIQNTNGLIFSVLFIKRSNKELRNMVARTGVKKGVSGKGLRYNPKDHLLLVVFDMHKKGFRMIPLDAVKQIKCCGITFKF